MLLGIALILGPNYPNFHPTSSAAMSNLIACILFQVGWPLVQAMALRALGPGEAFGRSKEAGLGSDVGMVLERFGKSKDSLARSGSGNILKYPEMAV